jgi:hypothetical protein
VQDWKTAKHAHVRSLLAFVLDRALRSWSVVVRLSATIEERALGLNGLLCNHWVSVQSSPPACGLLEKRPQTDVSAALAVMRGIAEELVTPPMRAALWAQGIDPWAAHVSLGKVRSCEIYVSTVIAAMLTCPHQDGARVRGTFLQLFAKVSMVVCRS